MSEDNVDEKKTESATAMIGAKFEDGDARSEEAKLADRECSTESCEREEVAEKFELEDTTNVKLQEIHHYIAKAGLSPDEKRFLTKESEAACKEAAEDAVKQCDSYYYLRASNKISDMTNEHILEQQALEFKMETAAAEHKGAIRALKREMSSAIDEAKKQAVATIKAELADNLNQAKTSVTENSKA